MAFDLTSFLQRELAKSSDTPSRRSNKNKSGRALNKAHNSRKALLKVGGYSNNIQAIYAPPGEALCITVPHSVGWLPDGKPRREPRN